MYILIFQSSDCRRLLQMNYDNILLLQTGFLTLMHAVNVEIVEYSTIKGRSSSSHEIHLKRFPYTPYTDDSFTSDFILLVRIWIKL